MYFRNIVNWCSVAISSDKSWLLPFFIHFLELIVTCRLCAIFVREDIHSGFAFTAPLMERDVEIDTVRERLINVITHPLTIYLTWLLP